MEEQKQVIVGQITEAEIKQFVYDFQAEIEVTLKLVERIAYEIFGEQENQDLSVGEVYAMLQCEYAKVQEIEDVQTRAMASIRFMRAVSVISITYGVAVPKSLLVLDRNVYDTIQAMRVIEKNQKELKELEEAKAKAEEAIAEVTQEQVTH